MGSLLMRHHLGEAEFRGQRFADFPQNQKGNYELLNLTQSQIIRDVFEQYYAVGADIVTTNTLNATVISMAEYGVADLVTEINTAAVRIAREVADEYTRKTPDKPRFVAVSIGPSNKSLSISPDVNRPAYRAVTFAQMCDAYYEQIAAVVAAGTDILLMETMFDTLNIKAALFAAMEHRKNTGTCTPIMLSATIADASGRMLAGQTIEAFIASVSHAPLMSIGLNCALGAEQMKPYIEEMAKKAPFPISAHPNAGLPNQQGGYDQTPAQMAAIVEDYMRQGWVNIVGGCCGTTPEYIELLAKAAPKYKPRAATSYQRPATSNQRQVSNSVTILSGLEPLYIDHKTTFNAELVAGCWSLVVVGERNNVAGSKKFARLIREKKYDEALSIARQQIESGAQVLDICMDDALLDAKSEMAHFLNFIASDPDICRVPLMIDSSKWEVIEAGLQCVQGKSIVNSISLKEGEETFLHRAKLVQQYGAALVVMLFDEQGQADTYERKIAVAQRSYRLLTNAGFAPQDIIFDPNILAIATGIAEHNTYALDFIKACEWIKKNLPAAKISGGVSNLSFSLRGNDVARNALHAVFLYYAVKAGMDMGIVNPSIKQQISGITADTIRKDTLLSLCEEVILNKSDDATERLIAYVQTQSEQLPDVHQSSSTANRQAEPVEKRLHNALLKGITDYLNADIEEALQQYSAMQIIEQPLMGAMGEVGERFGAGKMFLPQVVKSARVLRMAVNILEPKLKTNNSATSGESKPAAGKKILLATVKGDVHDIGKNIVSVVLACNGFDIVDLGVMIPCEQIMEAIKQHKPDLVGLSGLITPSLEEMETVASAMNELRLDTPLLIGGATTSPLYTALHLDAAYPHRVFHVRDASQAAHIARQLTSAELKHTYTAQQQQQNEQLRRLHESAQQHRETVSLEEARLNKLKIDWHKEKILVPKLGINVQRNTAVDLLIPHIDWSMFFYAWGIKGKYPDILQHSEKGKAAQQLFDDANHTLKDCKFVAQAVTGFFPAAAQDENILIYDELRTEILATLHAPRQLQKMTDGKPNLSLADFIASKDLGVQDGIGAFVLSVQPANEQILQQYRTAGDEYSALLVETLCQRLAEAYSEYIVKPLPTPQLRVAVGYSTLPDHSQKKLIFDLLNVTKNIGTTLTKSYMMQPAASACGLLLGNKEARYF
ncbi:methionine synthase [Bacteroidia bacterium]|nr:methionine synthase [Bacteroidia bacterium]GHT82030.1 methionine synthase [Bacteroidia bacterium]